MTLTTSGMELASQLALDTLRALQEDSPVLMALFDRDDMLQWGNAAFRSTFALQPAQMLTWSDLILYNHSQSTGTRIQTNDIDAWLASARSRRGKQGFRAFECDMHDGRWIWMSEMVRADGWMLCMAHDITELRSHGRDLRLERDIALRAAQTDALTGLSNRAHIMALLEQQLHMVRYSGASCGLALLDLDHFKRINDRFGHAAGDGVLQHFAQLLHVMLRREDGCGRIGGEEFLVLLPQADVHSLQACMQRLLQSLPLQRPLSEQPDFFYTCSIGMGLLTATDTAHSAFQRVDEALYAAKAQGRHRCLWATQPVA